MINLARKFQLVDDPKKREHPAIIHKRIIPRAGGVPMFLAFLLTTVLVIPFSKQLSGILVGGAILILIGAILLLLIYLLHCLPRRDVFENEIAILTGSNSEFLKETRSTAEWLDGDHLYLIKKDSLRGLKLRPLVRVGPSPASAKNACYFFNRVEKDGLRFVSYHFADIPEIKASLEEASTVLRFLGEL